MEEQFQTPKSTSRNSCLHLFLLIILIFVLIFLSFSVVVAKAGLVNVPILTPLLYKEPQEIIIPNLNAKEEILNKLIKAQEKNQTDFEITLTQEEVLGLLVSKIKEVKTPIENPQIILHRNSVESWFNFDIKDIKNNLLFGSILRDNIWIKIFFLPIASGEKIELQVQKVQIGSLTVPIFLINKVVNFVKNKSNLSLSYNIKGIKSLTLEEGKIIIKTSPDTIQQFESQLKK
jgi:uncharacterized protein YpmS